MTRALRLAMWSGPRNVSTALMRSWENRADTTVWDEPLYAFYLRSTGLDHPGAREIIEAGEPDWRKVVARILGSVPNDHSIYFQKHMTHHLLDEVGRDWLGSVTNCFLIRDPREVIASYARTRPNVTVADVGIPQQAEIYRYVETHTGEAPIVIDARDVLEDPRALLSTLCARLGVEFSESMLAWPAGSRESDGVWAKYWYDSAVASTGFAPHTPKAHTLPRPLEPLAEACVPHYRYLHERRLGVS